MDWGADADKAHASGGLCGGLSGEEGGGGWNQNTMRFGSTAKVLAKCMLKYYRISECRSPPDAGPCGWNG